MISTATTAVSTIVTSNAVSTVVSSSAVGDLIGVLGLCAVLLLVVSLVIHQLAANGGATLKYFARNLWVVIPSLLLTFSFITLTTIWKILD